MTVRDKVVSLARMIKRVISSDSFFYTVIGLFSLQATWIAYSSAYPLPFDEIVHYSITNFYTNQLSPFIGTQPSDLNIAGDATRLPSYLFYYLLSFPLRLIEYFVGDEGARIILLRFINVSFVVATIIILRKVMQKIGISSLVINVSTLLYCLLPVMPFLAAHINYDNLLMLCFALLLYFGQEIFVRLEKQGKLSLAYMFGFITVALLGCLVKFSFLPVAAAGLIYLAIALVRARFWRSIALPRGRRTTLVTVIAGIAAAASIGLASERFIVNLVEYGSPAPDCDKVQSVNICKYYGPWARNEGLRQLAKDDSDTQQRSAHSYAYRLWTPLMLNGLGFVGSAQEGNLRRAPAILQYTIVALVVMVGAGVVLSYRLIMRNKTVTLLIIVAISYVAVLFARNYSEFMSLRELVAVQGRYVLFLMLPLIALGLGGLLSVTRLKYAVAVALASFTCIMLVLNPHVVYVLQSRQYWLRDDPVIRTVYETEWRLLGITPDRPR